MKERNFNMLKKASVCIFLLCILFFSNPSFAPELKLPVKNLRKRSVKNTPMKAELDRMNDYYNKMPEGKRLAKGSGYKQWKRDEWFIKPRLNDDGTYPIYARWNAYVELANERALRSGLRGVTATCNWSVMGPGHNSRNTGGRMLDLAFDPNNASVIWAGAASGGIWKSTDSGASWSPKGDALPAMAVSCVVTHNTNSDIVYIGTGETNYCYDAKTGAGIFKTTDGGATWSVTGYSTTPGNDYWYRVHEMIMDHSDANVLLASTLSGLYRTEDGGANWTETLNLNHCKDIVMHPTDHNTVYVSVGESGIWKSTDNGVNWTQLTTGLPAAADISGRTSLDMSISNPLYLYSYISSDDEAKRGVYKTTDGGANWSWTADLGASYFSWYANVIEVDPTNPNTVYCGSYTILKSTDGGSNWTDIRSNGDGIHVDMHAFEFHPAISTHLWVGTDAGIYRTTDGGTSWEWKNSNLTTMQFYAIGLDPSDANYAYGGTQDNGTNQYSGTTTWDHIYGGDGGEVIVDYTDGNIIYSETQNGGHKKSYDRGDSFISIVDGLDGGPWVAATEMDPEDPNVLYTISDGAEGEDNLYRTTNGASSWSLFYDAPTALSRIEIAPSDNQTICVSGSDYLYRTTNNGTSWSEVASASGLPSQGGITYIIIHPDDPLTMYVTKSGYNDGYHIYKSSDGGSNWINITNDFPNIHCTSIIIDHYNTNHLYVGHDLGVHVSTNGGTNWSAWDTNLPNVVVDEIEIHQGSRKIRAGTHGRGMWESPLSHNATAAAPSASTVASSSTRPNTANFKGMVNAHDASTTVTFEYGPNASYGSTIAATPGTVTGTGDTYVEVVLTGQPNGIATHYRVKATNTHGTSYGGNQTSTPTGRSTPVACSGNTLDYNGVYARPGGVYEYVYVSNPSNIPIGNETYTIEVWINVDEIIAWNGRAGIVGWGSTSDNQANFLNITTSYIRHEWWNNNLSVYVGDLLDEWHHIAATFDGTTRKLYLDGALIGSDTPTGHNVPSGTTLYIGRTYWECAYNGQIDEVRIFNDARTQAEIIQYMYQPLPGDEDNLVAYWNFDEASGTTVYDRCVNYTTYNDGLLSNLDPAVDRIASTAWQTRNMGGDESLVLSAGYDPDFDSVTLTESTGPTHGSLSFDNGAETVTYTPNAGSNSTDTFIFKIEDASTNETYSINVTSGNVNVAGSGHALEFDGTDDYVDLVGEIRFDNTNTLEFWIKPTVFGSYKIFMGKADVDNYVAFYNSTIVRVQDDLGVNIDWTFPTFTTNIWYHIAITRDASNNWRCFLNGVESSTGSINNSSFLLIDQIGRGHTGGYTFNVTIDDVRIWDDVRTLEEIQNNMCSQLTGNEDNLIAYYRFNHAWGAYLHDYSSTYNHGTSKNMTDADWVTSGARLGDVSTSDFSSPTSVSLNHTNGDQMTINNIAGSPDGVVVYRIDEAPMVTTTPAGWSSFYSNRYWGVYVIGGTSPTYDVSYNYNGYPDIAYEDELGLVRRDNNADASWASTSPTLNNTANSITLSGESGTQYIMGKNSLTDVETVSTTTSYNFNEAGENGIGYDIDMNYTSIAGSGDVTVRQVNYAPTDAPCINVCNVFWDITKPAGITSFTADLTFHYTDSDAAGYTESNAYFGIAKYNSSTNTWQWLGGTVNATNNTVTVSGVASFSKFVLYRRIFGDITNDGYVDAADLQRLGDCWHATNSGEFTGGSDAGFFNFNKNTDSDNQIIDAADLQVFGDCWHNGTPMLMLMKERPQENDAVKPKKRQSNAEAEAKTK
jgi:photosystem II stability/assembly factor-like uncharacterized protein